MRTGDVCLALSLVGALYEQDLALVRKLVRCPYLRGGCALETSSAGRRAALVGQKHVSPVVGKGADPRHAVDIARLVRIRREHLFKGPNCVVEDEQILQNDIRRVVVLRTPRRPMERTI